MSLFRTLSMLLPAIVTCGCAAPSSTDGSTQTPKETANIDRASPSQQRMHIENALPKPSLPPNMSDLSFGSSENEWCRGEYAEPAENITKVDFLSNEVQHQAVLSLIDRAKNGDEEARVALGFMSCLGSGLPRSLTYTAHYLYNISSDLVLDAFYGKVHLGRILISDDDRANRALGIDLLSRLANEGNGVAASILGRAYADGLYGITPDSSRAVKFFRIAADNGNSRSTARLARAEVRGKLGLDDPKKGFRRYLGLITSSSAQDARRLLVTLNQDIVYRREKHLSLQFIDEVRLEEALVKTYSSLDEHTGALATIISLLYYNEILTAERQDFEIARWAYRATKQGSDGLGVVASLYGRSAASTLLDQDKKQLAAKALYWAIESGYLPDDDDTKKHLANAKRILSELIFDGSAGDQFTQRYARKLLRQAAEHEYAYESQLRLAEYLLYKTRGFQRDIGKGLSLAFPWTQVGVREIQERANSLLEDWINLTVGGTWIISAWSEDQIYFSSQEYKQMEGENLRAWILAANFEPQRKGGEEIWFERSRVALRCQRGQIKFISQSELAASGSVVNSWEGRDWTSVPPGSVGASLLESICE